MYSARVATPSTKVFFPPPSDINIFADGIKTENGVGATFHAINREGTITRERKHCIKDYCSINQAEKLAIEAALEWVSATYLTRLLYTFCLTPRALYAPFKTPTRQTRSSWGCCPLCGP